MMSSSRIYRERASVLSSEARERSTNGFLPSLLPTFRPEEPPSPNDLPYLHLSLSLSFFRGSYPRTDTPLTPTHSQIGANIEIFRLLVLFFFFYLSRGVRLVNWHGDIAKKREKELRMSKNREKGRLV